MCTLMSFSSLKWTNRVLLFPGKKFFKQKKFKIKNMWWYYMHVMETVFIHFLGLKILIKYNNNFRKTWRGRDTLGCTIWFKKNYMFLAFFKHLKISLKLVIKFAWLSMWTQNPALLGRKLKIVLSTMNFWKQKKIYYLLKRVFNYYTLQKKKYYIFTYLAGLRLKLKGKIAAGGNSRKRVIYYSLGDTGFGNYLTNLTHCSFMSPNIPGTVNLQLYYYKYAVEYVN